MVKESEIHVQTAMNELEANMLNTDIVEKMVLDQLRDAEQQVQQEKWEE